MISNNPEHSTGRAFASACLLTIILVVMGCGNSEEGEEMPISQEAAQYFQKAERAYEAGAYRPALMLVDSLEEQAPEFSGTHMLRGQVFTALDRYEDAAEELARAAELDPNNPAIHFNWANNAYRRQQYGEAISRFESVLELIRQRDRVNIYAGDEDGQEARYAVLLQMGRAYDDLGKADSSRMRYEQAIELASEKPEAYSEMSDLLEKLGEFDEALTYARKALERDPENIEYEYDLGLLLVQAGQYEEAVPYLEEMASERPWHHGSHYNLGQAYMHLGQEGKAETYLSQADSLQEAQAELDKMGDQAEVNQDNPRMWVEYGTALRQAGRIEDAKKAFRHALSLIPGNLALHNNMAILALESGDTTEAIMRYRAILQREPAIPDVWLNLGAAYANSGRIEEAREAWENALKYDPDHEAAQEYLARYGGEDSN